MMLAIGCSTPPSIKAVTPGEVSPGAALQIHGEHFTEESVISLRSDDGASTELDDVRLSGPVLVEGVVPAELEPGEYAVVVAHRGKEIRAPLPLAVALPPDAQPCSGEFRSNTELSLVREEIVVDRYFADGERETLHVPLSDVERVEYELLATEEGGRCSAIFVRTTDDRRIIFDDDAEVDLKKRAYALARDMGRPVEVTRDDATAMTDPDE